MSFRLPNCMNDKAGAFLTLPDRRFWIWAFEHRKISAASLIVRTSSEVPEFVGNAVLIGLAIVKVMRLERQAKPEQLQFV